MRSLNIKKLTRRHICSVRGCGNKDTVLFARSADLAGGIFICRDCVAELASFFFPPEEEKADAVPEPEKTEAETAETSETAETVETVETGETVETAESDASTEAVQEKRSSGRGRSAKK